MSGSISGQSTGQIYFWKNKSVPIQGLTEEDFRLFDRPFLGVGGLEEQPGGGLLIEAVNENGPAASAGLLAGDILIGIGETTIDTRRSLRDAISAHTAGDAATVVVRRGGKEVTLEVTFRRRD